jgi:hypothetical protein
MSIQTSTNETAPASPVIGEEVFAQGQAALTELCALEIPVDSQTGTGSLDGRAKSFNPLDKAQNIGKLATTGSVHDRLRARMLAQRENGLTINALGGLREVIIARQEGSTADDERLYGLSLLVTSKGTIVDGASYSADGRHPIATESIRELHDAADLSETDWQKLTTAADEVRTQKMKLKPEPYLRSRYPFALSDHFFHKASK